MLPLQNLIGQIGRPSRIAVIAAIACALIPCGQQTSSHAWTMIQLTADIWMAWTLVFLYGQGRAQALHSLYGGGGPKVLHRSRRPEGGGR